MRRAIVFLLMALFSFWLLAACSDKEASPGTGPADSSNNDDSSEPGGDSAGTADSGGESAVAPAALLDRARLRAVQAEESGDIESFRFAMTFEFEGLEGIAVDPGDPAAPDLESFGMEATGAIDGVNQRSHIFMSMTGLDPLGTGAELPDELFSFEVIEDGQDTYMKMDFLSLFLGADPDQWILSDTAEGESFAEAFSFGLGFDARSQIDILSALSDDFEVVGEETLRGVNTTHYSFTLDAETAAAMGFEDTEAPEVEGLSFPFEMWLDDEGRMRQISTTIGFDQFGDDFIPLAPGADLSEARMTMLMEFYDIGEEIVIELPDPEDVLDESEAFGGFGFEE